MAFNPFNIFRRNQRIIFAVITIIMMFTFVLSSGLGGGADFFDWLPNWIGSKTRKGEVFCTIDGRNFTESDVRAIRMQRMIANKYMSYAAEQAVDNLRAAVGTSLSKVGKDKQRMFEMMLGVLRPPTTMQELQQLPGMYSFVQAQMRTTMDDKNAPREDADVAQMIYALIDLQTQRMGSPPGVYFAALPNATARDAIEFRLWEKKADQFGIQFSDKDAQRLKDVEFLGRLGSAEVNVRKAVTQDGRGVTDARLWSALAAEFRVRLAQEAVLGPTWAWRTQPTPAMNRTLGAPPAYTAPFDLFEYYRENCSPTTYEVLAVPAASFLDKVTEKPTDAQMQELFRDHQNEEPNPANEQPGFKEPRKARIEWVSATGGEPFYKAAAQEWMRAGEAQAALGHLLAPTTLPGVAAAAYLGSLPSLSVAKEYEQVVANFESALNQQYVYGAFNFQVVDPAAVRAADVAAAVGAAAGSLLTHGSPFDPAALLEESAKAVERRTRLRVGLPLFLGAVPGPGMFATGLAGVATAYASRPKPLPADTYKEGLTARARESLARQFMARDLSTFGETLDKAVRDVKDPAKKRAAAAAAVDEFVKSRGLKRGETAEPRDEYTVGDDPALAPLKAVMDTAAHGSLPVRFGRQFFYEDDPMGRGQPVAATGVFHARFYPNAGGPSPLGADPAFLAWRTEEKAPQAVSFRAAEPKVLAAWRRVKARDLARQEAERIAKEMQAKNVTNATQIEQLMLDIQLHLKAATDDPKVRELVRQFPLRDVAPIQVAAASPFAQQRQPSAQRFRLLPSANVPYPSAEMQTRLLDDRTKPVGTAFVTADAPKDTYYVAVVADRREKLPLEFVSMYNTPQNPVRQELTQAQRVDSLLAARRAAVALLKVEFGYDRENAAALERGDKGAE